MAKPLADDPRGDAGHQRCGGVGVPHIVQPDAWEAGGVAVLVEQGRDRVGMKWTPIGPYKQQLGLLSEKRPLLVPGPHAVLQ